MGRLLRCVREARSLTRLGHARFGTYVRERLGQSARWGEILIELARAVERFPSLGLAFERGDLSTTKVILLSRVVTDATSGDWIALARATKVSDLEKLLSRWRPGDDIPRALRTDPPQNYESDGRREMPRGDGATDGQWVQILAPAPLAHLYDHTIELVRRLTGDSLAPSACMEHILEEFATEHAAPGSHTAAVLARAHFARMGAGDPPAAAAAHPSPEADAEAAHPSPEADAEAARARARGPARSTERMDPLRADRELRRLARTHQRRHAAMARCLHAMKTEFLWVELGYASFDDYCEWELGIARRTARELVWAHGRFRALPRIGWEYMAGRLSWAKARLLFSICTLRTQDVWIERARQVTARYLEHEVTASRRRFEEGLDIAAIPLPISYVPPGAAESPVRPGAGLWDRPSPPGELSQESTGRHTSSHQEARTKGAPGTDRACTIRFWLTREFVDLFRALTWDLQALHRTASSGTCHALEPWQVLMALLEHFLHTWDRDEYATFATQHRILSRDGFQCAAPGCQVRRGLEVHHIVFRSRGGSNAATNVITLCAIHHREALHETGGLRCWGAALDALHWTQGAVHYRGDIHRQGGRGGRAAENVERAAGRKSRSRAARGRDRAERRSA